MTVYEYITSINNKKTNELTVDFIFDIETSKSSAIEQIDMLVQLADDNENIKFLAHEPKFFEKSKWSEVEEE
tara:strand:- start:7442 stop:7657 length:216 start_codon:yes stop_codon:yes gene_type:complete